ncbi:MerR family transcriptional regulator [Legionella quateirensis]|uniref:Mercury resistance transcriptional regulator SkgA n=1 Tax=Legionella quateirensis TaxID=45072 RepID=A0A378KRI3_9GAMM|nr:MerR family transcriptional regulator [Legionella quateirensis]KTD54746.1 mercury resistance transcriptional regulator SkgA [Legionella quateirensis]STY16926.1 transcriptional regulator SkgA, mercury resistanc [Legionella quateirensis]
MHYTVKKLAELSGVSARTLRFYDEIGLLKPAFYGENQYRYYEEEQLLMLQQILFFRELGFPLNDIQRIISSDDFDKIESLKTHKSILQSSLERTDKLIRTIDKTISHIRGKLTMRDKELYDGFDPAKQKEHEQYLLDKGTITQKEIDESWNKVKDWKKNDWEQFKQAGDDLNKALVNALTHHLKPESDEVQKLIRTHYTWVKTFWTPNQDTYIGLGQVYLEHQDFREFYTQYHPDLAVFLIEAMNVFAKQNLS